MFWDEAAFWGLRSASSARVVLATWTPLGRTAWTLGRLVDASRALLDASWTLLGALGRLLDASWTLLAALGRLLDASWTPLGRSWLSKLAFWSAPDLQKPQFSLGKPWFSQGVLACCRIALGLLSCRSWTPPGTTWTPLGANLDGFWTSLGPLGRLLGRTWLLLGAS